MYEIPEGKRATKGKSIVNFLSIESTEKMTSILPMQKTAKEAANLSLLMITKNGIGKRVSAESFHDVRRSRLIAIKLKPSDELVSVFSPIKANCGFGDEKGQLIRFKESDLREMGRAASGSKR